MLVTNVQWAKAEIEKGKLNFDYITGIAQAACSRDLTLSIALDMSKVPNWIYDAYPSARISFPVFDSYFISTSHNESMTKANIFLDVYTKYQFGKYRSYIKAVSPVYISPLESRYQQSGTEEFLTEGEPSLRGMREKAEEEKKGDGYADME